MNRGGVPKLVRSLLSVQQLDQSDGPVKNPKS